MSTETATAPPIEQRLWQHLLANGLVQGDLPDSTDHAPWPVRFLMGAAGWLGALFLLACILIAVFITSRDNGMAITLSGLLMLGLAVVLYRCGTNIGLQQFALAASLCGQGLAILGATMALGMMTDDDPAAWAGFWLGVALCQLLLYGLIANALHRLLAALGVWISLTVASTFIMGIPDTPGGIIDLAPIGLSWLAAIACVGITVFVLAERRLCASGWRGFWEPAAHATLLFALCAALLLTGARHPLDVFLGTHGAAAGSSILPAGIVSGATLTVFAGIECRRLGLSAWAHALAMLGTAAFCALMATTPALGTGALAMGLALRRGSLTWLGLGIAAIVAGFSWYYSALHWSLLHKSIWLFAAGLLLLASRMLLLRLRHAKEPT